LDILDTLDPREKPVPQEKQVLLDIPDTLDPQEKEVSQEKQVPQEKPVLLDIPDTRVKQDTLVKPAHWGIVDKQDRQVRQVRPDRLGIRVKPVNQDKVMSEVLCIILELIVLPDGSSVMVEY
jgi:hypothetical protein